MSMQKAIEVVAALARRGVIKNYAITGAVAALAYIEPTSTQDLDILVAVSDFEGGPSGLILLKPLEDALATMGYAERSDVGVIVEGWPVQFIPTASELDEESLREAVDLAIDEGVNARVLRPEHLVAKAISVGRLKDLARVEAFLDQAAVTAESLRPVIQRHRLGDAWRSFCMKSGRADLLGLGSA